MSKIPPVDTGTSAYSQQDMKRVEDLLLQLDTATPELLVKSVVYEVTTENGVKSALSLAMSIMKGKIGFRSYQAITAPLWALVVSLLYLPWLQIVALRSFLPQRFASSLAVLPD